MLQRLNTSSGNLDEAGRQVGKSVVGSCLGAPKNIPQNSLNHVMINSFFLFMFSLTFCEDDESWDNLFSWVETISYW